MPRWYKYTIHLLAGISIGWTLLWMVSCSPKFRHDRIVRKYPFVHTEEVVTLRDTVRVVVPEVKVDTVFYVDHLYDTIHIREEHLTAKIFRVRDSVFLVAQCDTIFRESIIERQVPVTVFREAESRWWKWLYIIPLVLIGIVILYRFAKWILQSYR